MSHGCDWVAVKTLSKSIKKWQCIWCKAIVRMPKNGGLPKQCHSPSMDMMFEEAEFGQLAWYEPNAPFKCQQGCGTFRRDRCSSYRGHLHCPVCRYLGTLKYLAPHEREPKP